jgi:microcystin-dependent protein
MKRIFGIAARLPQQMPQEFQALIIDMLQVSNLTIPLSHVIGFSHAFHAGQVSMCATDDPPPGWLICDGSAISRTQYPDLFDAIGTTYGSGDGSSTFNIPDLRGRVAVGKGTNASVDTLGENDGVTVANRRPQHRHTPHSHYLPSVARAVNNATNDAWEVSSIGPSVGLNTNTKDGGSGNANDSLDAPAYLVINFIIKT